MGGKTPPHWLHRDVQADTGRSQSTQVTGYTGHRVHMSQSTQVYSTWVTEYTGVQYMQETACYCSVHTASLLPLLLELVPLLTAITVSGKQENIMKPCDLGSSAKKGYCHVFERTIS